VAVGTTPRNVATAAPDPIDPGRFFARGRRRTKPACRLHEAGRTIERSFGLVGQEQDRFRFDLPAGRGGGGGRGGLRLSGTIRGVFCCDRVLVFYGGR
jgi:hypothetical protein